MTATEAIGKIITRLNEDNRDLRLPTVNELSGALTTKSLWALCRATDVLTEACGNLGFGGLAEEMERYSNAKKSSALDLLYYPPPTAANPIPTLENARMNFWGIDAPLWVSSVKESGGDIGLINMALDRTKLERPAFRSRAFITFCSMFKASRTFRQQQVEEPAKNRTVYLLPIQTVNNLIRFNGSIDASIMGCNGIQINRMLVCAGGINQNAKEAALYASRASMAHFAVNTEINGVLPVSEFIDSHKPRPNYAGNYRENKMAGFNPYWRCMATIFNVNSNHWVLLAIVRYGKGLKKVANFIFDSFAETHAPKSTLMKNAYSLLTMLNHNGIEVYGASGGDNIPVISHGYKKAHQKDGTSCGLHALNAFAKIVEIFEKSENLDESFDIKKDFLTPMRDDVSNDTTCNVDVKKYLLGMQYLSAYLYYMHLIVNTEVDDRTYKTPGNDINSSSGDDDDDDSLAPIRSLFDENDPEEIRLGMRREGDLVVAIDQGIGEPVAIHCFIQPRGSDRVRERIALALKILNMETVAQQLPVNFIGLATDLSANSDLELDALEPKRDRTIYILLATPDRARVLLEESRVAAFDLTADPPLATTEWKPAINGRQTIQGFGRALRDEVIARYRKNTSAEKPNQDDEISLSLDLVQSNGSKSEWIETVTQALSVATQPPNSTQIHELLDMPLAFCNLPRMIKLVIRVGWSDGRCFLYEYDKEKTILRLVGPTQNRHSMKNYDHHMQIDEPIAAEVRRIHAGDAAMNLKVIGGLGVGWTNAHPFDPNYYVLYDFTRPGVRQGVPYALSEGDYSMTFANYANRTKKSTDLPFMFLLVHKEDNASFLKNCEKAPVTKVFMDMDDERRNVNISYLTTFKELLEKLHPAADSGQRKNGHIFSAINKTDALDKIDLGNTKTILKEHKQLNAPIAAFPFFSIDATKYSIMFEVLT